MHAGSFLPDNYVTFIAISLTIFTQHFPVNRTFKFLQILYRSAPTCISSVPSQVNSVLLIPPRNYMKEKAEFILNGGITTTFLRYFSFIVLFFIIFFRCSVNFWARDFKPSLFKSILQGINSDFGGTSYESQIKLTPRYKCPGFEF